MPNYSGVWNLVQQLQARGQNLWPATPGAPTSVSATAGNTQATVSFTAPADTGVPAGITGYRVTSSPGAITATGASSPITVTGLTNDTSYTFTVAAQNATGYGPESSPSGAVTPTDPNFFATLRPTGFASIYATGGAVASDGSWYTVGYEDQGDQKLVVAKYTSSGTLVYQYRYVVGGAAFTSAMCQVDASGNLYIAASWASNDRVWVLKLDSSGGILWGAWMNATAVEITSIYLTGSTLYIGTYSGLTTNGGYLISLTVGSSATLNWARYFGSTGLGTSVNGITVSPSGYVYICGWAFLGSGTYSGFIARFDSGGTNVWRRNFGGTGKTQATGIATDSSDNLYVGSFESQNPGWATISIFDSNYTGVARIQTASSSSYPYPRMLDIDGSGNIYFLANAYLAKWNSSYTLQFARSITAPSTSLSYGVMDVLNSRIYLNYANRDNSASRSLFFSGKIPADGTATGTYNVNGTNYTYASSSAFTWSTVSAPTTSSGVGQTSATPTVTSATGLFSRETPTYTASTTTF